MHPGICKPKEISTNVDTSADISSSEMDSRTCKSNTEELDSSVDSVEYVDFFPSKLNHSVHNTFK